MLRTSLFMPVLLLAGVAHQNSYAQDQPAPRQRRERAFLGVSVVPLNSELKIVELVAGGPAEGAGLKKGDRILSVDGTRVGDVLDFVRRIGERKPGDQVTLEIRRDGERQTVDVTLGTRRRALPPIQVPGGTARRAFLGVGYAEVSAALATHLRLDAGVGVLVTDVRPGSAADKAGIVTYDVIVRIGRDVVKGRRGLVELIGRRKPGDEVTLDTIHRGEPATRTAVLGERTMPLLPLRPRGLWRGRLRIGDEFDFDIPWGFDAWPDSLPEELKRRLDDGELDDGIRQHLEEAFRDFEAKSLSSSRSVARFVEGDLDVTVTTDDDGQRITVKKNGETIAENLPYEKLDSLPEGVLGSVRALIEKYEIKLEKRTESPSERVEGIERFKI